MENRDDLVKKIEKLPSYLLEEVAKYVEYIEFKSKQEIESKVEDITLASEESLGKDWLKPEEDEAWKDL